jgi:hypothetical protein
MIGVKYILFTYMRKQIHGFGTKCKASLSLVLLDVIEITRTYGSLILIFSPPPPPKPKLIVL